MTSRPRRGRSVAGPAFFAMTVLAIVMILLHFAGIGP